MFRTVKKLASKQESSEVLSGVDSEFDAEQDTNCEMDVNADENQEMSMKTFEHQLQDDDLDVILQLGQNFVVIWQERWKNSM
jgi:hypothetical protein